MNGFEALKKIHGTEKRIKHTSMIGRIGFNDDGELFYFGSDPLPSVPLTGFWPDLLARDDWKVIGEEPKSPALEALDLAERAIKQAREALK